MNVRTTFHVLACCATLRNQQRFLPAGPQKYAGAAGVNAKHPMCVEINTLALLSVVQLQVGFILHHSAKLALWRCSPQATWPKHTHNPESTETEGSPHTSALPPGGQEV